MTTVTTIIRAIGPWMVVAAATVACRGSRPTSSDPPEPSSSAAPIGVMLGACSDLSQCESECDAGSADRCRRLAATYALGQGVARDEAKATALYEHACAMHDAPACVFAGQMHEYAHGVPKDDERAASLYDQSCADGWTPGCYNLAIMLESGRGVALDRDRAAGLYASACAAGASQACEKARAIRGSGPQPDR